MSKEANAIAQKQLTQRDTFWPNNEAHLWNRKANKGFATIPKTMPLILQIMDDMSDRHPLSSTYMGLWCSTWDNSFVVISKPQEMAHAAGFSGQRAEYTWRARMKLLEELEFISTKPGKAGPFSYVIVWNPHYVIRRHYARKTPGLVEATYNALLDWAIDVGAKDMLDPLPETAAAASAPPGPPPAAAPTSVAATGAMPLTVTPTFRRRRRPPAAA